VTQIEPAPKFWRRGRISPALFGKARPIALRDLSKWPAEVVRTKTFVSDAARFIVDLAHKRWLSGTSSGSRYQAKYAAPVYSEIARIGRDLPWERTLVTSGTSAVCRPTTRK